MSSPLRALRLVLSGVLLLWLLTIVLGGAPSLYAQSATLRGFVTDRADGQALEAVNVVLSQEGRFVEGTATVEDGLYVMAGITPGRYVLTASFIGYETYADTLNLEARALRILNIALLQSEEALDEVLVESERTSGAARITAGQQTIRPRDIERIPTPDLSGDLVNYLSSQPGVVATGDRGGQLFIRGGEPSQNLVQLDGILLYQPFHLLGFYSAFPSDIINRTDFFAGGFGSKYGERISSVIDVATRNGNDQRVTGGVSLSPFVSALRLEGPLVRRKVSLLASARTSLLEQGAEQLVDEELPFTFNDVFVKAHGVLRDNQRASITALQTYDRGILTADTEERVLDEIRWRNQAVGARYLLLPNLFPVLFDGHASYSRLTSEIGPSGDPSRRSTIENINVALDGTLFTDRADWKAGSSVRSISINSRLDGLYQNLVDRSDQFVHWGLYLEPEFSWDNGLRVQPGIRIQFFDVRFQAFYEPRLRVVWNRSGHQLSGAIGVYQQAVMGLSDRRDAANVFTAWTSARRPNTAVDDVSEGKVQRAIHVLGGYRANPMPWLEVSAEGFFKALTNLFIAEWTAFPRFTTNLQPASGRSFGFDLRAEVRRGLLYGYINYGLSSTRYRAKQASLAIWYGTERLRFRPPHDRRHQLNTLINLNRFGFDFNVRWELGSGLPFSRAVGFDGFALIDDIVNASEIPGSRRVIYERPFNGLLPAYHRLDLSLAKTFSLGGATIAVQGSAINVYDRRNLFYLDVFTLERVDQLPFIPSFGLKIEFE